MNANIHNDVYFNFAKKLFYSYNILQIPNELSSNFSKLSLEYNLNLPIQKDIRNIYNEVINRYYHNEIAIKSNFINNILLKSNNHVTVFEFNLENSRADLCKIGTKSIAFEIKTDLDNFYRLKKQITDYSEVFEEIYVICSKTNLCNITNILPSFCGIYSYNVSQNGDYKFRKEKTTESHNNIKPENQLKLLTKKDLKSNFSKAINNTDKEIIINTIIDNYTSSYINSKFKKIIKQKYNSQWEFLKKYHNEIYEIDYQWFFKNNISPSIIYQK